MLILVRMAKSNAINDAYPTGIAAARKVETNMSSGTCRLLGGAKTPRLVLGEWPKDRPLDTAILWVLKIACGLNFLFTRAWGVVGKEAWTPSLPSPVRDKLSNHPFPNAGSHKSPFWVIDNLAPTA